MLWAGWSGGLCFDSIWFNKESLRRKLWKRFPRGIFISLLQPTIFFVPSKCIIYSFTIKKWWRSIRVNVRDKLVLLNGLHEEIIRVDFCLVHVNVKVLAWNPIARPHVVAYNINLSFTIISSLHRLNLIAIHKGGSWRPRKRTQTCRRCASRYWGKWTLANQVSLKNEFLMRQTNFSDKKEKRVSTWNNKSLSRPTFSARVWTDQI